MIIITLCIVINNFKFLLALKISIFMVIKTIFLSVYTYFKIIPISWIRVLIFSYIPFCNQEKLRNAEDYNINIRKLILKYYKINSFNIFNFRYTSFFLWKETIF